jgi:hypothetical protein
VIRYGNYGRKVSWIVKKYGNYGRDPSCIVKRFGQYERKASWIVIRFGKYGRKASWIVNRYDKCGRKVGWIVFEINLIERGRKVAIAPKSFNFSTVLLRSGDINGLLRGHCKKNVIF